MKNRVYWEDCENAENLEVLKDEIAHFENLILISEMADIISHEIRNPMTTIRGFLQMFMHKPTLARNQEYLQMMIDELDGVNSIISGFLAVNVGRERQVYLQDLNIIIESVAPLIQAMAHKEEKLFQTDLQKLPKLLLNIQEIRHMIIIMCRNSLEAMGKGRILSIATKVDGDFALMEIKDEGKGIDPKILENIGTPFLTTKETGTGLGLSVCYSICKRHEAEIQVNTSREGTLFTIKFKIPNKKTN